MLPALQCTDHLFYQIIYVQQFQLHSWVIDGNRKVVGIIMAKSCYSAVIVRLTPLSKQIWETVNQYSCTSLLTVVKKQLLSSQLAFTVVRLAIPANQRSLNRGCKHHRTGIAVFFQCIQQSGCKSKITTQEFLGIFRTINTSQIKYEVRITAGLFQQLSGRIAIIQIQLSNGKPRMGAIFSIPDACQGRRQIFSYKACSTGNQYIHIALPP